MGLGAEAFTVLAILEARDMATEIYDKVEAKVAHFSETMKAAADSADVSGAKIDESFLATASGADALSLATAKVEAAQGRLAAASKEQADAEKALLDAQEQARVAADGDTEAMDRQIAAADKLAVSQKETAKATKTLRDAQADQKAITEAQSLTTDASAAKTGSAGEKLGTVASTMGKVGLGVALAGGLMVKGASDFQSSTTVLETSGGETAAQLETVRKGILNLSGSTGTALKPLTDGMYMVGSAGYTGGAGLRVLQSAAQGAKAENADLGTVSNALTTILKDYGVQVTDNAAGQKASNAVMDQMIAVVSNGKTTTEQLASSLSAVLPIASSVGLSFAQVGGAMATMTGEGMSAQQAAQNLNNVITNLAGGNNVATKEMQQLGLNVADVRKALSDPSKGLTGALDLVTGAIQKNSSAGGMVVQAFQNSAAAAKNAQTMIAAMPKSLQDLANSYLNGSISSKDFKTDLQNLDPVTAHMMTQFGKVADQTHEFNDALTKGTPAQQSAAQAMQKMLGGTTGLNVALMLGGKNTQTFHDNVQKVADAAKGAGSSVDGWKEIQGNFNQKLAEAKQTTEAAGISIGTALLPMVTRLAQDILAVIGPIASWIQGHQKLTMMIIGGVAGLGLLVGTVNLAVKAFGAVKGAIDAVSTVISKVIGLFGGASTAEDAAAASADGAAASMDGLAASEDAATTSTEASTVAADANSAGWIRSSLAAAGAAVKFLAVQTAQIAVTVATKAWTAAQWLFNAAMDANPIMLVVIAIAALAGGVIYAYTHFQAFRSIVEDVWNWLKGAVTDTINFVKDHWEVIVQIITGPIGIVATQVYDHWQTIKRYFTDAVNDIINFLTFWFVGLPLKFAGWLANIVSTVARGIGELASWWLSLPGRVISAIFGFFSGLGNKFGGWMADAATATANKGIAILNWIGALPGKVLNAVSNFGSLLFQAGKDLVQGLINGVQNMASSAIDTVKNLGGDMVHGISSILGISSPSRVMADEVGKYIPAGIAQGIAENVDVLRNALTGAAALSVTAAQSSLSQSAMAQLPAIPATGPGIGSSGSAPGININIDLKGAYLLNNGSAQQLAQAIGNELTTMLPRGGVRVNM